MLWVANTVFDGDCAVISGMGSVHSEGGSLESPADTCDLDHPTDQVGVSAVDLALGPLQNNGGSSPTHALLPGSVAIDAGNNALCPLTDQRGWLRTDGACDIGAFERDAVDPIVFTDGFETGGTTRWSGTVP